MARPRRAVKQAGPARWVLVVVLAAVVVALAGLVLVPRFSGDGAAPSPGSAYSPPDSPSASSRPSPTASTPSPTASSTASADGSGNDAAAALTACRKAVAARDDVLAAARTGVGHWAEHVGAQLDADAGAITVPQMNAIFARTRLAGPADLERFDATVRTARRTRGPCGPVSGAATGTARRLAACAERERAQKPVLAAAEAGMTAWRQHLADMRRDAAGGTSDPEQQWRTTYAAAPKAIDAYQRAVADFDAPRC